MLQLKSRVLAGIIFGMAGLAVLSACGPSGITASSGGGGTPPVPPSAKEGRTFFIKPDANATRDMQVAMVLAAPGDVIEFDCGFFDLTSTLQLTNTEDILIKGCGKDKTILSFKGNNASEGMLMVNVNGITIQDLTVLDTGGDGFVLKGVDHGTLLRVRAIWSSAGGRTSLTPITKDNFATKIKVACTDPATKKPGIPENMGGDTTSPDYTVSPQAGRYGIYPVSSDNILIDGAESIGASDAGIYVGQTNNAIIKNSRAAFNVFGFEIENVQGGEYQNNIAECNTGGFLVYDLNGNLRQYGDRSRMYGNISRNNNTYNFAGSGFVGSVPAGSGMITLSYDQIDIFDNEFRDNNTGGIIHASYELFPEGAGRPTENHIDWYTEGVHIYNNRFFNNGNALPAPTTADIQDNNLARLLPALVGLKNLAGCLIPTNLATCAAAGAPGGYRGAHIIWDGLLDVRANCSYPVKDGQPVAKDARGKPQLGSSIPEDASKTPEGKPCHYNAYKFAEAAPYARKLPDWVASCIGTNQYSSDSLKFANFHGLKGLEPVIAAATASPDQAGLTKVVASIPTTDVANFASSFDLAPQTCSVPLKPLPPVVIPPFVRSGKYDPAPSAALVAQLCGTPVAAGAVNFAAAPVNCPTLDQYNLFSKSEDPTSAPNGGGVPFVLTTKLFSDYSVKYRVAYMPPGTKATYHDAGNNKDKANVAITFPVGTIIAKTFSFRNKAAGTEVPMETRLLIKRNNSKKTIERWDGLPYIWETVNGKRVAKLSLIGGSSVASWDVVDADSGIRHTGSTASYQIPNANQCLSCHSNEDKEPGSSPIGPKVRFLNRPYAPESDVVTEQGRHEVLGKNQLQYWCSKGLMSGCPADLGVNATTQIAANVERVPIFNKVGDGHPTDTAKDIEARARAYLEVNCQHCHNDNGFAKNTGFYLDSFRKVDQSYGICKGVTAAGTQGSNGRSVDIHPGDAAKSVLEFRISSAATTAAARMPPLARSVVHEEGHDLVQQWINTVIVADESKYPSSTSCTK